MGIAGSGRRPRAARAPAHVTNRITGRERPGPAVVSPPAVAGDDIRAGPVIEAPALSERLQQFGVRAARRHLARETLRRTMGEMRLQVVTLPEDARFVAGCADRAERKNQQGSNRP